MSPTDLESVQMNLFLQVLFLYTCIYYKKGLAEIFVGLIQHKTTTKYQNYTFQAFLEMTLLRNKFQIKRVMRNEMLNVIL